MKEYIYPLTATPYIFVGKKPSAVLFGDERVDVKSWREVYTVILKRCNEDPVYHEALMYLRDKTAGKVRVFLSGSPEGMTRAHKIDEGLYGEVHYGSATLMHILTERILAPAGYDCSAVSIVLKG
jgi:hypothetical protein